LIFERAVLPGDPDHDGCHDQGEQHDPARYLEPAGEPGRQRVIEETGLRGPAQLAPSAPLIAPMLRRQSPVTS
jgi:hypothetical protein